MVEHTSYSNANNNVSVSFADNNSGDDAASEDGGEESSQEDAIAVEDGVKIPDPIYGFISDSISDSIFL